MVSRKPPWPPPERSVVAVGLFDGVHRGHKHLLSELAEWGREASAVPVVVTFHPHPERITRGSAPPLIVSPRHRIRLISELGIERIWLLDLDPELLGMTAEAFLAAYVTGALNAVGLLVGFNNRLGKDRADYAVLRSLGPSLGLEIRSCDPLIVEGEPVSSTSVRQAIVSGDIERAERLLGRPVSLVGTVIEGAGRGRRLGFPTANLNLQHEATVPCGVYSGRVEVDGRTYSAAVSVGACPTFGGNETRPGKGTYVPGEHRVEVHILDFSGDLLGRELEVMLKRKLREERKFPTEEALIAQLRSDVERIRAGT